LLKIQKQIGGHWGPREEAKSLSKKANVGSGAKASREGLEALLKHARSGDTLVVWRLDRLGRSS